MEVMYVGKKTPEIIVKVIPRRNLKSAICECIELKGVNWSLSISHVTMSVPLTQQKTEENQPLVQEGGTSQGYISSTYARLQRATRGNLLLLTACVCLIVAAGVLLFPQKTWNRLMLKLFGCIHFNVNGHQFKMCEEVPEPQNVQLF